MSINQGVTDRRSFGGQRFHTTDHPPVFHSAPKKPGSGEFAAGLMLALDDDGALVPYVDTGLAGVCDVTTPADAEHCVYLVHGTGKRHLLRKGSDPAAAADVSALADMGVFPV